MSYSKPSTTQITPTSTVNEDKQEIETKKEITLEKDNTPKVITVSEMVGAKSNAVTDVFIEAIDRYKRILSKELILTKDQTKDEQRVFMTTLSNTLDLEFKNYVLVTDYIVKLMRDNPNSFNEKTMFEILYYVQADYSKKAVSRYMKYVSALYTLSQNLRNRARIGKMVDVISLSSGYHDKAATNIQNYFNKNYS